MGDTNYSNLDCTLLETAFKLFKNTLDEFGAISAEDAANLWAKGVKNRNGALQYSVLNTTLKLNMERCLQNTSWVTGVSSPWVEDYKITKVKKVSLVSYEITVKFHMVASKQDFGYITSILFINKKEKYWLIYQIK